MIWGCCVSTVLACFVYFTRTTKAAEEVLQEEEGQELPWNRGELAAEDAAAAGVSRRQVAQLEGATTKDWQRGIART